MNRILLTGKNGQIGWELLRTLSPLGEIIAPDRSSMDLNDPDSIRAIVRDTRPTLIVNAAAYTAVDMAESEPDIAMAVNGLAPGILAEEAKRLGALLVHYSTDYVFDGTKDAPYTENDAPCPINVYGRTKLAGEDAIKSVGGSHLIFRTSWVYGWRGKNFLLTILRLMREKAELKVVDDQVGSPTWSRSIAEATAQIVGRVSHSSQTFREVGGTYNLSSQGQATWYDFARIVVDQTSERSGLRPVVVVPISARDYASSVRRPAYSVLRGNVTEEVFGIKMPPWKLAFDLCLSELFAARSSIVL